MRHLKAGRKLGRTSSHRRAMYSNMVAALVTHGQIETTEAKAKELRTIADRTLHWGVGVHKLVQKGTKKLSDIERAQVVHAKRMARRVLKDEDALDRLFAEVAPELASHPGGYTRVLKTRYRVGDAAPMALVALVSNGTAAEAPAREEPAKTGRGKKGEAKPEKADKKAKADKSKAKAKKSKSDDE
jgi:large subunit ribosomal protein L17